jgi:exopolysaccharide biosynthesis protein
MWKDFSDVLRRSNKTFIGYNKRLNKQYLIVLKNVTMAEAIAIMTDNSTGEAYDIILMLDGGGSTFMDALGKYVFQGQNTRRIHNILRFK